jgi:DNA-binding response OmpR family regulator
MSARSMSHVSWLRGKLAEAGVNGVAIRTVYGAGYQLVLERDDAVAYDPGAVA